MTRQILFAGAMALALCLPASAAALVTLDSPANGSVLTTSQPTFTGTAEAGSTVKIYLNGASTPAFTTTADANGN